ncbi:MAG: HAD-IB family hydrolase, partial [Actinobacteria bacterium]|nr:HAD-IB family hydrolase [Actinomycetota bacterium]
AFFDVDNTILRGSSSFLFGKSAFERKFFSRKDFWRFAWHQFVFIWKGENNTKLSALKDRALSLVEGQRVSDLQELVDEVYEKHIKLKLWPETVRLAKDHIKQGREVWLVTAAPQELGDVIAHELGLTGAIGTKVERKNGILTGKLVGKPIHGAEKRKALKALAKDRNLSLKRSYAYSDSQNDLPMLTAVGHPVAVNPDKILTRYAKAADWPIYDFKKRELKANRE